MADIGRISGPMLADDLLRQDVDLAFDTDLLYLDVGLNGGQGGVGINTDAFTRTLEINGKTRTVELIAPRSTLEGTVLENNQVKTINGPLYITASGGQNGVIVMDRNEVDDLYFDGNVIGSKNSNVNINLDTSGTGDTNFYQQLDINGNLYLTGTINVDGNVLIGGQIAIGADPNDTVDINPVFTQNLNPASTGLYSLGTSSYRWLAGYISDYVDLENLRIEANTLKTTISNSNLELSGSGTGGISAEHIRFADNVISNTISNTIVFNPNVVFDKTNATLLPVGTTAQRSSLNSGELRYNTTKNNFEGYAGSSFVSFNEIADTDVNTKIYIDPIRSNDSNSIKFQINGILTTTIDSTKVNTSKITVNDTISIDSAVSKITTQTVNGDVLLSAQGTGDLIVEQFNFSGNTISSTSQNINLSTTGRGYFKFAGNNGLVIPSGPTIATAPPGTQIGDFRLNTDTNNLEVFNGVTYALSIGPSTSITQNELEEIIDLYTIIFG
jgi:hypothetical protein